MEEIDRFEFLQTLLRNVHALRVTDTPMNELAFVYKEGHEEAINSVMNLIRREL